MYKSGACSNPSFLARRQHRNRIRRARRAQIRPFQRVHRDIHMRIKPVRIARRHPNFLADKKHRRLVALAFANHNGAIHAHVSISRRMASPLLHPLCAVAKTHGPCRRNRRLFHHAQKFQTKRPFHLDS